MTEQQSLEDAFKSLINELVARQMMTEHMVLELYFNHAQRFPDADQVIERLVGRLTEVADVQFGVDYPECRRVCAEFIEKLQSGYSASHRASDGAGR